MRLQIGELIMYPTDNEMQSNVPGTFYKTREFLSVREWIVVLKAIRKSVEKLGDDEVYGVDMIAHSVGLLYWSDTYANGTRFSLVVDNDFRSVFEKAMNDLAARDIKASKLIKSARAETITITGE